MEIYATAKFIRTSPRKLTLLVKNLRGIKAEQVVRHLSFTRKAGAVDIKKLVISAIANATQKNINRDALVVKSLNVLPGGSMKRFRAVSRGMAHTYKKRMSHVKVTLTDELEKPKAVPVKAAAIQTSLKPAQKATDHTPIRNAKIKKTQK